MSEAPVEGSEGAGSLAPVPEEPRTVAAVLREWLDVLVIAVVLGMFVRVFMVELFEIPSGSMAPTLVGGYAAEVDYNGDGLPDLLLARGDALPPQGFENDGRRLVPRREPPVLADATPIVFRRRFDKILVNKMAYWFRPPRRGEIVVFKAPEAIWDPVRATYVKRCAGEPGDVLTFDGEGHLEVGGHAVEDPPFFRTQRYRTVFAPEETLSTIPGIQYDRRPDGRVAIVRVEVPRDAVFVLGDNTEASLDSRYWGFVPLERLRGRAFLRCWPWPHVQRLAS